VGIYRNISMNFWTDSKIVDDFTPEDRYIYIYCLTGPHSNLCGCYEVSIKQIANETGYSTDTVGQLLRRLNESLNVIRYSSETKELLVLNWARHNWSGSEKLDKRLLEEIRNIKCDTFREYLADKYNERGTVSISYNPDVDTQNISESPIVDSNSTESSSSPNIQEKRFDMFWKIYPLKVGKVAARKAWSKIKPDTKLFEKIMCAVETAKISQQWKRDNGKYIPHPTTWLNQGRWDDEIPEEYGQPRNVIDDLKYLNEQYTQKEA